MPPVRPWHKKFFVVMGWSGVWGGIFVQAPAVNWKCGKAELVLCVDIVYYLLARRLPFAVNERYNV